MSATPPDPPLGEAEALACLAQARDPEAWALICTRAGPQMQRVCARLAGDPSTADDALQEALLHLRDHAGRFTPPTTGDADAAARAWILRVTTTTTLMLLRRRRRSDHHERIGGGHAGAPGDEPDASIQRDEANAVVRAALVALPEPHRTVLTMHHIADLPIEQIAIALQLPVGTVKSRLMRGREDLRRRLERVGILLTLGSIPGLLAAVPAGSLPPLRSELLAATRTTDVALAAHSFGLSKGILMATAFCLTGAVLIATVALQAAAAVAPPMEPARTETSAPSGAVVEAPVAPASAGAPSGIATATGKIAHPFIRGKVTAVNTNPQGQQDLVMLTVGKEASIVEGTEFIVFRGNQYIVKMRAEKVLNDTAACRVISASWNAAGALILVGDDAQNRHPTDSDPDNQQAAHEGLDFIGDRRPLAARRADETVAPAVAPPASDPVPVAPAAAGSPSGSDTATGKISRAFIQAKVAAVNINPKGQQDLVMLTMGKEAGIEEGMEFIVFRGSQYIVKMRAEKVLNDAAACRVIPDSWNAAGAPIQVSDDAQNLLRTDSDPDNRHAAQQGRDPIGDRRPLAAQRVDETVAPAVAPPAPDTAPAGASDF